MMVIRPIESRDAEALRELARITGAGFTSLQDNDEQVAGKLAAALAAFTQEQSQKEALYLFVLEDLDAQCIAGICGIESAVGLSEPWYNYRVGTMVHASRELDVYNQMHTLTISNDHTGYSELCTLFLHPDYRHSRNGHLLSKSRFLFLAEFPQLFNEKIIAEMRGFSDKDGVSPFWEGLGKHFFSVDFPTADRMSSIDKAFIAELMPKYTLYTNLLPKSAQEVIGTTHENTLPARKLLEREGMRFGNYVDIFDGGPTLEGNIGDLRAVKESHYAKVLIDDSNPPDGELHLISTTQFEQFRCVMSPVVDAGRNVISIDSKTAAALEVREGATVRIVPLLANKR
ncbi:MAG: arginine N-succinyltransferase [Pseudomonadales bacterium]